MAQSNWEADKMLDVYIYDYLTKRNLQNSAKAFLAEGKVSSDPVAIDAPGGFLFEWWSVFWDIFIARTNEKHSEVAAAYIETQQLKAREQQQQQPQNQQQQHQQQLQLHQMQLMRHAQPQQQQQQQAQPRRDLAMNGSAEALLRQSTPTANAMAAKIYEERLKLDESALKRYDATPLDANQAALMKTTSTPGQPSGPVHSGAVSNSIPGAQARPQQMLQDNKSDIHMLNQRSPATDPSLFNVKSNLLTPANQGASKSWSSLAGMDQRLMQPQKPFLQSSSQAYQQLHGLTSHQQQLLYQAQPQGSIPSSGLADMDPQRFRMLLNRSGLTGKVGQTNVLNDPTSGVGSPVQAASPLSRATSQDQTDLVLKMKLAQMQQQQSSSKLLSQQNSSQQQQQPISQQQQPISQQQQERMGLAGVDGTISSYRSNDQIYGAIEPSPSNNSTGTGKTTTKNQNGRKRKQPASSSGPANSTGTANTAGRSPNSPSTPSTHTPGDVMSMGGAVHQIGGISKSSMMYGTEGHGTLASPSNQLADIDRLGEDGSLDDNVESFLSHEEADPREGLFGSNKRTPNVDVTKGFTFNEVGCLHASTNKVVCCHFSSDGKLLASAGHEKKAVLWNMDTLKLRSTLEEHSFLITDVRFSPNSTRLATSSFDKTVRVWDADNPSYSLRTFTGHQTSVMSLDFHPTNEDLLCSCDGDSEIRYWSVSQGVCTRVFKGGMTQTRFQPRHGRYLAAAAENVVSIFDVETETCRHSLQRHTKPVHSVCWDATGEYLASVSEDSVRVWTLRPGSDGECVHELSSNGNKFHSCVFHPNYPTVLIIGCYESLELWNMTENKSMTIQAHNGLIAALAQSPASGMVASASHDKCVKLWK